MDAKTFDAGTRAKCNRCDQPGVLPKPCQGQLETHRGGVSLYRLTTLVALDCGHVDGHWVHVHEEMPNKAQEQFDLLQRFYALGDGTTWNPQGRTVTFVSMESAAKFKELAPDWTVQYRKGTSCD